jgi:hypothetical protein
MGLRLFYFNVIILAFTRWKPYKNSLDNANL